MFQQKTFITSIANISVIDSGSDNEETIIEESGEVEDLTDFHQQTDFDEKIEEFIEDVHLNNNVLHSINHYVSGDNIVSIIMYIKKQTAPDISVPGAGIVTPNFNV